MLLLKKDVRMYLNSNSDANSNSCYDSNSNVNKFHQRLNYATHRTTSLYGLSGLSSYSSIRSDQYTRDDNYLYNYNPKFCTDFNNRSYIMASKVKKNIKILENDEICDNLASVLREKRQNNDFHLSNYNDDPPWLCESKLICEKLHNKNSINLKKESKFQTPYRHSEIESDNLTYENGNNIPQRFSKRKLRTRSESETAYTSEVMVKNNNSSQYDKTDLCNQRKGRLEPNLSATKQNYRSVTKLPPANHHLGSTGTIKTPIKRTTKISNVSINSRSITSNRNASFNRLNEFRRCRTKSPSPTYVPKKTSLELRTNNRKPAPTLLKTHDTIDLSKKNNNLVKCKNEQLDDISYEDEFDEEPQADDNDDLIESSSDSEDAYKEHIYQLRSTVSPQQIRRKFNQSSDSIDSLPIPESPLVSSLFPYVPPYLAFSTNAKKGPDVPPELFKILKWRTTTIMPRIVRQTLTNSGYRLIKKTNDWMGTWGKHLKSPLFKAIRPHQKINHLPGSFKIGRKDACWRNLQKQMVRHGKKEFGFMPKTYILPNDLLTLRKSWPKYVQRNVKWIIKPPASARGAGIRVINRWAQIPKRRPLIVQRYIERPLLINGNKFDLRLYVLVTSINPLRVYMCHDGLVRFAAVKYSSKSETLNDRCMHLTNYSINKHSSSYSKNEDVNACDGHKWTLQSLWAYLSKRGVNIDKLWATLKNLVIRTLIAGESSINNMVRMNVESKYSVFELFGFDVLLDTDLVPWLLEVNISPSLHSDLPLDIHVKAPLIQAVLNTALYHVPPKLSNEMRKDICAKLGINGPLCYDKRLYITHLSKEEKLKHAEFTRRSDERDWYLEAILENLTPDDVRCLIKSEDELARSEPLERIFPTHNTHRYLKYTENPRYYNRLLDAWETRHCKNREAGYNVLRKHCYQKLHLQTPPAPVQKQIKIRTRTLRPTTSKNRVIASIWPMGTTSNYKRRNRTRILPKININDQMQLLNDNDDDNYVDCVNDNDDNNDNNENNDVDNINVPKENEDN